mgnify:CR=1 FL=1
MNDEFRNHIKAWMRQLHALRTQIIKDAELARMCSGWVGLFPLELKENGSGSGLSQVWV